MRVVVSRENYLHPGEFLPVGEFTDLWYPMLFTKALMDETSESDQDARFLIDVQFEEEEAE